MAILKRLYVQVLLAVIAGVVVGVVVPDLAKNLKWLGDLFIALIRMIIAPIIFCTIVHGIAAMGDLRKVGRVGLKALIYFEVVSTLALLIGVIVGEVVQPGAGFGANPATLDPSSVARFASVAAKDSFTSHIIGMVPPSFFGALADGELLQVLLVSILTGVAVSGLGKEGAKVVEAIDLGGKIFFRIIGLVVKLAPLGAFGAISFTVGQYGLASLRPLLGLIATFYVTAILFILIVLGTIARWCGFSIFRFIAYIKDELLIVLGTASSETVLPQMMLKMEGAGASKSVVGLVIPTGYSFNLDGTNIYMTLATIFLSQAIGAHLSVGQYATIIAVAMLTSKGSSGVTGAGFITLAATLAAIPNNPIPVAAMTLILGIDKFMSECRSLTNLVGNGVATLAVAKMEGELDFEKLRAAMARPALMAAAIESQPLEDAGRVERKVTSVSVTQWDDHH